MLRFVSRFLADRWRLLALVGGASCGTPDATLSVQVPSAVLGKTAWIEVGFVPGGCPPLGALAEGLPLGATVARLAFAPEDAQRVPVGLVPAAKYGLAATARDAQCAVLATGCASIDLASSRALEVSLAATASPAGACAPGTSCSYARCVPPITPTDPSVGAGCSLQLMGAGPLQSPLAVQTQVGAPAIAVTDAGFLIAYREVEPVSGMARLTLFPLDNGGAALTAHQEQLSDRCMNADETDAVGLALAGASGVVALARSPCMGKSGFDLFAVSADGQMSKLAADSSGMGAPLRLSVAHALATTPSGYLLGARQGGAALLETTDGATVTKANATLGAAMDTNVWVATSSKLVAAMVAGASKAPVPDGGVPDGGAVGPVLRLHAAPMGTPLASLPAAIEIPGVWGSLAALGSRLVVVSSGATSGKPVAYRTYDLIGNALTPGPADGFNTNSLQGKPLFADVALVADRMLVAVEQPSSIALVAFDHATTMPVFKREVDLGDDPRLPSLAKVRDGRVAIAASQTRVAVVWATAATLDMNDPVGGYAVFACR